MAWTVTRATKDSLVLTGDSIDASGANSSTSFRVGRWVRADVQLTWASHSDTSTVALQSRNNGSNWVAHATDTTTSGASGSAITTYNPLPGDEIRLTITETDANGSATVTPVIKFFAN